MTEPWVRAIVLDFNGTLAQDDHLIGPLFVETLARVGAALTMDEYHRELAALPDRRAFELALERAGLPLDESRLDALVRARIEGYRLAVLEAQPIAEHAIAFVRAAARQRLPLAIASGAFRREIEYVLAAAGIAEHFAAVVPIEDVRNGKPHPEGFLLALARLNQAVAARPPIEPNQVVAVEDATGGARGARSAGMRVVAIRGSAYDESSGVADLVIERLDLTALELILRLDGESA